MPSEPENKNRVKSCLYRCSMRWAVVCILLPLVAAGSLWMCRTQQRKMVRARHDLGAYTIVKEEDLEEIPGTAHVPRAVNTKAEAVNQITIAPIPRNEILTETMLYKPPQPKQLKDWDVLFVPLGAMPAPDIGEVVKLVTLEQGGKKATILFDKAVALGTKGDQIVLAVPRDTAEAAAFTLLSKEQLLVLRSLSR